MTLQFRELFDDRRRNPREVRVPGGKKKTILIVIFVEETLQLLMSVLRHWECAQIVILVRGEQPAYWRHM